MGLHEVGDPRHSTAPLPWPRGSSFPNQPPTPLPHARTHLPLEDPRAHYDDTRTACAMRLLARIAQTNQVLLFTCRDDVVRAAQAVNAPILQL